MPKKVQFTHERVEHNVLSKSVYTQENSQILTVSTKKKIKDIQLKKTSYI
jgi:hypothetical protein